MTITMVAALSVVSIGPMASVASAQGRIPLTPKACKADPAKGISVEAEDGTKVTVPSTGKKYECVNGTWVWTATDTAPEGRVPSKETLPAPPPIKPPLANA